MLVVISDLHFGDGSATENIKPRAFDLFYDHVLDLANHAGAREITLLFLGDVFDLLRTEYWFYPQPGASTLGGPPPPQGVADPFPPELRPWGRRGTLPDGTLGPECEERTLQIADAILRACAPQLAILRGEHPTSSADDALDERGLRARVASRLATVKVTRLYLPGNHDRLARVSGALMERFCAALGAEPAPEIEPGLLRLSVDGTLVVARHGHERDDWNFEPAELGTLAPKTSDFRATPLGDVITTELLARLPYLVRQDLVAAASAASSSPPGQTTPVPRWIEDVYEHLKGIEDVRPLGAIVRWVVRSGRHLERLGSVALPSHGALDARDAIDKIARHLVLALIRMEFTKAWCARRRLGRPGARSAFLLRLLGLACRWVPLELAETVLGWSWVARLIERGGDDRQADDARRLLEGGGTYAVLGHTHDFRHIPLHQPPGGPARVYLNSGTWRPRVYEARDRSGFRRVKELTYLVFYGGERARYEAWNGVKL